MIAKWSEKATPITTIDDGFIRLSGDGTRITIQHSGIYLM
jgi:hypothetical protein